MGSSVRRQTSVGHLVEWGKSATYQLLGNVGNLSGPLDLTASPGGSPCLSMVRQYDIGALRESPGCAHLETPLQVGRVPLGMGTSQPGFAKSNACAGQTELGSWHAVLEQCPLWRMDALPSDGSENLGNLWEGREQLFEDNCHCQIYFSKDRDVLANNWPSLLYVFRLITLIPQVIKQIKEHKHKALLVAPLWRNQLCFSELSQLLIAASWSIPLRQDLLSG